MHTSESSEYNYAYIYEVWNMEWHTEVAVAIPQLAFPWQPFKAMVTATM